MVTSESGRFERMLSTLSKYLQNSERIREQSVSFRCFLHQERKPLLFSIMAVVIGYLILIFSFNVHYCYSMMVGDSLLYFLKGLYLAHGGGTAAKLAENAPPFNYVGLPGYVRAPLLCITDRFDTQLRLIQITNLFSLCIVGVLSSYLLYVWIPLSARRLAVPVTLCFLLLSTVWQINVLLPLSDIVFSVLFQVAIIAIRSVRSVSWDSRLIGKLGLIAVLIPLAAMTKFTGYLLAIYACLCWIPLLVAGRAPRKLILATALSLGTLLSGALLVSTPNIISYAAKWLHRTEVTKPLDWFLNLLASSIPGQIIPNFYYFYSRGLTVSGFLFLHFNWFGSVRDVAVEIVGASLTMLVLFGAWKSRAVLFPEIVLLILLLPVIAPVTTSTTRYLAPLQALIFALFVMGLPPILSKWIPRGWGGVKGGIGLFVVILGGGVALKANGVATHNYTSIKVLNNRVAEVASTYRSLDELLRTFDKDKSRLLYFDDTDKWYAISGVRYIAPDSNLEHLVRRYDVYLVVDYDRKLVSQYGRFESEHLKSLSQWGRFRADLMADVSTHGAVGRVYRIRGED